MRFFLTGPTLLFVASLLFAQASDFTGVVVSDKGAPLAGTLVVLTRIPESKPCQPRAGCPPENTFNVGANTDNLGNFKYSGLTPGRYIICPMSNVDRVVSFCSWTTTPPIYEIGLSGSSRVKTFSLPSGHLLTVQVHDPNGRMSGYRDVSPVFFADGQFAIATFKQHKGDVFSYTTSLPLNRAGSLMMTSSLKLSHDGVKTLPNNQPALPLVMDADTIVDITVQ